MMSIFLSLCLKRFSCSKCSRKWTSSQAMVVFRIHLTGHQGTAKMRRLRQSCKQCSEAPMEEPHFSPASINIVLDHLMEKIGVQFYNETPAKKEYVKKEKQLVGPHEESRCEACKQGVCTWRGQRRF